MPPLEEYTFVNYHDSDIKITLKAHGYEAAMTVLIQIVKNPADFKYDPF